MNRAERGKLLADAYRYQQGIPQLEDEMLQHHRIPADVIDFIHGHTLKALVDHVSGLPVAECPWDRDDPHRFRNTLAGYWWTCFEALLKQYRANEPTVFPAPPTMTPG